LTQSRRRCCDPRPVADEQRPVVAPYGKWVSWLIRDHTKYLADSSGTRNEFDSRQIACSCDAIGVVASHGLVPLRHYGLSPGTRQTRVRRGLQVPWFLLALD